MTAIRLTLMLATWNARRGCGGDQVPWSSHPSLMSITIAWSSLPAPPGTSPSSLPNTTAMRATTVAGLSNSRRKIFSCQSTGPPMSIVIGASDMSYGSASSPSSITLRRSPKRPCVATGVSQDDTGRARSSSTNSTGSAGRDSVLPVSGLAIRSTMPRSGSRP